MSSIPLPCGAVRPSNAIGNVCRRERIQVYNDDDWILPVCDNYYDPCPVDNDDGDTDTDRDGAIFRGCEEEGDLASGGA
jgi:hypothetical protein